MMQWMSHTDAIFQKQSTIDANNNYIFCIRVMLAKIQKFETLDRSLSMKSPKNGVSREYLKQYMLQNYDLYEKLFEILKDQKAFYLKPEPLRHPLIFYYGHTASFFINKLLYKGIIESHIDEQLEAILAVGVDQMDWDDLDKTQYNWPTLSKVRQYRKMVRNKLIEVVDKISVQISWNSDAWILLMGIEHQKVHYETSAAIIRRLPIEQIIPSSTLIDCPMVSYNKQNIPDNSMKIVPAFQYKWGRESMKTTDYYGWDNQFGDYLMKTPEFKASTMLVSNGEYLEFVQDDGYLTEQHWDREGLEWLKSTHSTKPIYWIKEDEIYKLRTLNKQIPLPLDWPAEVNNLQATAFCNWKGKKLNKKLRLPTEQEYHALRDMIPYDLDNWEYGKVGNINLEVWNSPCPVNIFQTNGFYDIIGNVWQHTCTPLYPFKGFEIHPDYEDYSTPTFDCRHYIIKGGSFATIGDTGFKHARDAFRRHFFQSAGFRYVESSIQPQIPEVLLHETDEEIEYFLKLHYQQTSSYIQNSIRLIKQVYTDPKEKFLHVGCSVGMMVLEMSKQFAKSYGTDFCTRYFQMASRMLSKGELNYRDLKITTDKISPKTQNIVLYQINPQNPDSNKINGFKVVVIDGLCIKQGSIERVLKKCLPLMLENSYLLLINSQGKNEIIAQKVIALSRNAKLIDERCVPIEQEGQRVVKLNLYFIKLP